MSRTCEHMDLHSHLSNAEPAAIEALYRKFLDDPNSVDPTWRHFFLGFDFAQRSTARTPSNRAQPLERRRLKARP